MVKKVNKPGVKLYLHWIMATATAATMGLGYIHSFVFPRTEGERLQLQVDQNTQRYERILEILIEIRRDK